MDLMFAAVARISRGGPMPLPPEGGVPTPAGTPHSFAVLESLLRRSLFLTNCR